jgi:hypothetical protein
MDIKEQVFGYLIDIEEDKAAELIRESEFKVHHVDEAYSLAYEFDIWSICLCQILIKAKYYKDLESTYVKEKVIIEEATKKIAQIENWHVDSVSWYPLPRLYSEVAKYNQNDKMKQYLIDGDVDSFFNDVKSIFAGFSYNMKVTEAYFHSNIHMMLKIIGFNIVSEDETNLGRIDSVIELDNRIYIIEFKTSNAQIAIDQIKSKKYYEKYLMANKDIFLVGVECSLTERNVQSWKIEKYIP